MTGIALEESVVQNLKDAGCEEDFIRDFMECFRQGRKQAELDTLARHRKRILDKLHETQKEIECLDYLIYQIGKQEG